MSHYSTGSPWIPEREASVCLWKPDYIRGYMNNMNINLMVDVLSYSRRQLIAYVHMFKACGFTGIQMTDLCSAWRGCGSWERVHDSMRIIADAAHECGMRFTLWVWAAEFSGHGWHDDEAVYAAADGGSAYDDPRVFAFFNKYYDIYADLAPCCDRLIAHFYDPGNLSRFEDVIRFARLLADKFRRVNPQVKLGIDTWGCSEGSPRMLVDAGLEDRMLMELPFLPTWREEGKRARFREGVKAAGCELGVWGRYTAEYETDQNPYMTVSAHVLSHVYNTMRAQADHVMVPSYHSEMDAYHVINFPSLYCAGHLLIDPERDPDELMAEAAALPVGEEDGRDLLEVFRLVEDARSGDRWETYWWTEADYRLGTLFPTPDAVILRRRAEACLATLQALIDKRACGPVELPIEHHNLLRLMLPHIEQIRRFADFRVNMADLEARLAAGEPADALAARLDEIWEPIPEYDCLIGAWGQPEVRVQANFVKAFCRKAGIALPRRPNRWFTVKKRYLEYQSTFQRGHAYPVYVPPLL